MSALKFGHTGRDFILCCLLHPFSQGLTNQDENPAEERCSLAELMQFLAFI